MTKRAYCKACSNAKHGVKTPRAVAHTCGKTLCEIVNDKKEETKREESLLATMEIIKTGYAGVMPNGHIVDRRIHPEAVPIPENPLFNTPKPKKNDNSN